MQNVVDNGNNIILNDTLDGNLTANRSANRSVVFTQIIKDLLTKCEQATRRQKKADVVLQIMKVLEDYSDMIFDPNSKKWEKFAITVKRKYTELQREEEVRDECKAFITKYFDERCRAYTRYGVRCKNRAKKGVSKHFCGVHNGKFIPKIFSIIETELAHVEAQICVSLLF